ncbi:tyrosine-type recombinase/integrase [Paraburkholderia sp. CNPSo 3076]|uniref:tyrosine-type recombinase/integrase n=1 Tax=Paraburkholderia sp. CNPSo 3076 TaxID=2940936 RepID=UPI00224C8F3C|nr:tyrosine-type recombinase/integrase [Paraburkholderia sp. CNPSo 3076]MCX5545548.1 tyrosine-type recombinase/integrase [Paraburkholderia sp. CNPSo 3076]
MERLIQQRNASPRTVAAYRDTMRLLLQFTEHRLHRKPERLELSDIDAPLVLDFLNHLEVVRQNSIRIRSRNLRLAAIRSFLHYAASRTPESLGTIQQVLAIPMKRYERPLVRFLSREEICALLDAPNPNTWCGQRDRVMLATLYNTGARVSELIGIRVGDVDLDRSPSVRLHGKGRKERVVPLWRSTASQIRLWLRQIGASPGQWLFPNRSGGPTCQRCLAPSHDGGWRMHPADPHPNSLKRRSVRAPMRKWRGPGCPLRSLSRLAAFRNGLEEIAMSRESKRVKPLLYEECSVSKRLRHPQSGKPFCLVDGGILSITKISSGPLFAPEPNHLGGFPLREAVAAVAARQPDGFGDAGPAPRFAGARPERGRRR